MNKQGLIAAGTVFQSILIWRESAVLLKLEGHEGVIFDVQFLRDDFLASVSDDRSLRLWRLEEGLTGYQQVAAFYGHRSRVWKVRELDNGALVTVSEDTTCKVWQIPESEACTQVVSKALETLRGHQGKSIRSLACSEGLIATGGDDGAIKIWDGNDILLKRHD